MFSFLSNLFSKKATQPIISDVIWLSSKAKNNAIETLLRTTNTPLVLIAFFTDTEEKIQALLAKSPNPHIELYLANRIAALRNISQKKIILLEHFPLVIKEDELLTSLIERGLTENIDCHSALDEPFLSLFNSVAIVEMMQKMGMKDDETIQHTFITRSIVNARAKIAAKVGSFAADASSQEEWMKKNYKV